MIANTPVQGGAEPNLSRPSNTSFPYIYSIYTQKNKQERHTHQLPEPMMQTLYFPLILYSQRGSIVDQRETQRARVRVRAEYARERGRGAGATAVQASEASEMYI